MTAEKLNYLITLAEEQNLTRAARRLFITQPTLTVYINNLEAELGVTLFDRKHNPVRLTRCGEIYLDRMKRLVAEEQRLKEELFTMESPRDTLRIGIGYIHSEFYCADLASELKKAHPSLNIQLLENQEGVLMEYLKNDDIDLFFGHVAIDSVNFHFETVCDEMLTLLISRELLEVSSKDLRNNSVRNPLLLQPEQLASMTMISPASFQGLYLNVNTMMNQYHIHPPYQIRTANVVTAIQMAAKGLGYFYGSPALVSRLEPALREKIVFCTLPRLSNTRKFYCGYSENNPNLPVIREAVDFMKTLMSDNE